MNWINKHKIVSLIVIILLIVIAIIAWGTSKPDANVLPSRATPRQSTTDSSEPTHEELNQKLKTEATEADFVKLNGHTSEYNGLKVFVRGEISLVDYKYVIDKLSPSFTLTQHQGDGYGMYHVLNLANVTNLKDGDSVIVYGVVLSGTDETTGLSIRIFADVIEKTTN